MMEMNKKWQYGGNPHHWKTYVEGKITELTDTHATITCEVWWRSVAWGYDASAYGYAEIGGDHGTGKVNFRAKSPSGKTAWIKVATTTKTYERRDYDISAKCYASVNLTSGAGAGFSSCYVHVVVPKRTKTIPYDPTVSGWQRLPDGRIQLGLSLNSKLADRMEIYRQKRGDAPDASQQVYSGAAVTTFTDIVDGTDEYRYYAVNISAQGARSDGKPWSDWIPKLQPPAAPILKTPVSGEKMTGMVPWFSWVHNSVDGSPQTAAEIRWKTDGEWTVRTLQQASSSYEPSDFPFDKPASWQVRTKGAYDGWGEWSKVSQVTCYTPTKVRIISIPTVQDLPLTIRWTYTDNGGLQQMATVTIKDASGNVVAAKEVTGREQSATFGASELHLNSHQAYTASVTVVSTTSLTAEDVATFQVALISPAVPYAEASVDDQDASVMLTVHELGPGDTADGKARTVSMKLMRGAEVVAEGLHEGDSVTDPIPPLDTPIEYVLQAIAANGSASSRKVMASVPSHGFVYFNFADDMARMRMNAAIEEETEMERTEMQSPNRRLPVAMYGTHRKTEGKVEADVWWLEDMGGDSRSAMLDSFKRLGEFAGTVIMRQPQQQARSVTTKVTSSVGDIYNVAKVSVDYTEVSNG